MPNAILRISGAWAEALGVPLDLLSRCLSAPDPKRTYNRAYRDGRWDGMVPLNVGSRFPAGLSEWLTGQLEQAGYAARTVFADVGGPIDPGRFDESYLPGITLWPHQMAAVRALLASPRGVVKSPTASGKTEIIYAAARYLWEERGWRSIVLTSRRGLAVQNARRFEKYTRGDFDIGIMGDGYCTYGPIISATAQTLIGFRARRHGKSIIGANLKMREVVRKYEVMFYDECHHASSSTWFEIGMQSGAFRRYGLSGTPLRAKQLNDMQLIGVTGPLIYSVEATDLIAANLAARPKIVVVVADGSSEPELPWEFGEKVTASGARISVKLPVPYPEAYRRCVVCSVPHNNAVVLATSWLVDHKRRVLVLCRQKEHFLRLGSLLEKAGVNHIALWGATDMADRLRAKEALNAGRIQVILSTVIFDEGEDLPQVNAIVLAEGVQSDVNSVQRVGRGMRPKSVADAGDVWVVDIVPTGHTILLRHGLRRVRAWEKEGYPVRLVDEWPSDGRTFDYDSLLPFLTWDHAG